MEFLAHFIKWCVFGKPIWVSLSNIIKKIIMGNVILIAFSLSIVVYVKVFH